MVRFFEDNATNATRALQIWQILIGKAHNRQTVTYGMLADMLGYRSAGIMSQMLGHIMYYCSKHGLPSLTALVVNQDTGVPGEGLTVADLNAEREAVFRYDWYSIVPPTHEELSAAYQEQKG